MSEQEQQTDSAEHRAISADMTAEQEAEWRAEVNGTRLPREIAADWHGGQFSALYAYASTGTIVPGFSAEVRDCIRLASDDSDREELTELLSLGEQWTSGTNVPGYMPDGEPDAWDTFAEAKQAVIDELLWDADHADSEDVAEELTNTAEDVNLWGETDTVTEHSVTVADRAYWIARVQS